MVTIHEIESGRLDKIQSYDIFAIKVIDDYESSRKAIEPLYKRLLSDEKRFPLSNGFERYINAFRNYLNSDIDIDDIKKRCSELSELNSGMFSADAIESTRNSIFSRVSVLIGIMNENPTFTAEDCCNHHIKDMSNLYPDYDQVLKDSTSSQGMIENAIYAYFKLYYSSRKEIELIRKEYKYLKSYLSELEMKFSTK